ncbi:MAG: heavy metal translocating P-type ATPase, partial [Halobacteriota archaeon]
MTTPDRDERTLRLSVPEMDCPSCAGKVESALEALTGVVSIDTRPAGGTLHVRYDPAETTDAEICEQVRAAGYEVERNRTERFDVPGMDCPSCAGKIESALEPTAGIAELDTRPASGTVVVEFDPDRTSVGEITAGIEGAGYAVESNELEDRPAIWQTPRATKTAVGAGVLLVGILVEWVVPSVNATFPTVGLWTISIDWIAYVLAAAIAGAVIVRNGYYSAKARSLDIDLLMSAGILGALAVGLPFEAATLAVLFSIAELLERYSMDRARNSLRELMELSPDTATVRRDGEEVTVPVEDVAVGETVLVRPGENVPIDGVVADGQSALDESPVTGESVPVDKAPGDEVYAGSRNTAGFLAIEATAPAGESTLARVIELVEDAESERTEREQFVDRFAAIYTPIVVAGALLTMSVPPLFFGGPFTEWFVRGLTLLVIACPCAFVISTPVSVVSGLTSAARNGVLIKGGTHLEAMGAVDTVAIDKTGTLTTGQLGVTDVVPLNGNTETDVLSCAAAIERRSEHPIAEAIVEHAEDAGVDSRSVASFEAMAGQGVSATLDGVRHYAGKPALFAELGFNLEHAHVETDGGVALGDRDGDAAEGRPRDRDRDRNLDPIAAEAIDCEHGAYLDLANGTIPRLQTEGKTVVLVGTAEEIEGVIAVSDTVRPEAAWAVDRLGELGVDRVVVLTGDNERTARAIGDAVGVDEVRADLLPEDKLAAIEELRETSEGGVAMVGDGINDAPALATATVGIAMGAAGTDAAIETADVALMADDLTRLPYLYDLSRRANGVIKSNIVSSLGVKALLAIGAPFGYVTVIVAVVVGDMG